MHRSLQTTSWPCESDDSLLRYLEKGGPATVLFSDESRNSAETSYLALNLLMKRSTAAVLVKMGSDPKP